MMLTNLRRAAACALALALFLLPACAREDIPSLTETEKTEIAGTVKSYYSGLESGQYVRALDLCDLSAANNDSGMTVETREACLRKLRQNIVSEFRFGSIVPSNGSADVYWDRTDKTWNVLVSLRMACKGTTERLVNETAQLRRTDNRWEIVRLQSADRYAGYRVGKIRFDTDAFAQESSD